VQQATTPANYWPTLPPPAATCTVDFSHAALVRNGYGKRNGSYSRGKN
jgi:hypothetical protein